MHVTGGITELDCRKPTRLARYIAAGLGCLVLSACASQSTTAPPASTASTASPGYSVQLCSEAVTYQTAANDVLTLDVSKAGTEGVKQALLDLQTATNNLVAVAANEKQFGAQLPALDKASTSLDTTVEGLGSQADPSASLGEITSSVSAVDQAAKPIMDSLRAGCPSVPPAETPPAS
jgi:hypothetical protein